MTTPSAIDEDAFLLSRAQRVAFGAGSLATATYAVVPGLVLLHYLTNTLAVTAAIAGLVIVVPKVLDLVYNPMIGWLSDRATSATGSRRPMMLVGIFTFPVAFVGVFSSPLTGNGAAWFVAAALAVTGLAFSAFAVPFGVLPAELAAGTRERQSLTAWRMAFLGCAILIAGGVTPALIAAADDPSRGHRTMAVVMAGVMAIGAGAALYSTRGSTSTASRMTQSTRASVRATLAALRRDNTLARLFLVFVLIEASMSAALAGLPFLADYLLGSDNTVPILFLCVLGPLPAAMPLWIRCARRYGDQSALRAAVRICGVGAAATTVLPSISEAADCRSPARHFSSWASDSPVLYCYLTPCSPTPSPAMPRPHTSCAQELSSASGRPPRPLPQRREPACTESSCPQRVSSPHPLAPSSTNRELRNGGSSSDSPSPPADASHSLIAH